MSSALNSATTAQEVAGTTSDAFTSPARQQSHLSAAKGYVHFQTTAAINQHYNVTSVVKNGVGDYTITWTVPFSDALYIAQVSVKANIGTGAAFIATIANSDFTATTTRVQITDIAGALADPNEIMVLAFGTQ